MAINGPEETLEENKIVGQETDYNCGDIIQLFEGAPVTIKYAPDRGRYMVASRRINYGDVILENEVPFVAAIMHTSRKNVCNTCQTHFKESNRHNVKCCSSCEQVYYCSYECKSSRRLDT